MNQNATKILHVIAPIHLKRPTFCGAPLSADVVIDKGEDVMELVARGYRVCEKCVETRSKLMREN